MRKQYKIEFGRGEWEVIEQGRLVDSATTKQSAKERAERLAQSGDTIQVFNKDGTLFNEFLVGDDGLTAAFDEGRNGGGRREERRDVQGGGLFGAGLF
jgi:hypothetical protein